MRAVVPWALGLCVGVVLVLSEVRWFARRRLPERLGPYVPGGMATTHHGALSLESFHDVLAPAARSIGSVLARLTGSGEDLALRLERLHSPLDVTAFRMRQLGWAVVGFVVGTGFASALHLPFPLASATVVAGPLLGFLVPEHRLASASAARQRRVVLELPVVIEQLATLLAAGYSLGAAFSRLSVRGTGACAEDIARMCARVRHGLSEVEAFREWAALARVAPLDRLVPVVALNREAADLARLLSEEARAIRRDVHRELVERVERRAQQVWIPVTVATLVPGVVFLAVPFVEALRAFSAP